MSSNIPEPCGSDRSGTRSAAIVAIACLLAMFIVLLVRPRPNPVAPDDLAAARPAEEIVAEKVSQFASSREKLVTAMAGHFNVTVPPDVARFFAAVQAGNWPETTKLYELLKQNVRSNDRPPEFEKLWPVIVETYGAAEQVHLWPSQKLLDYGHAILDSLRPGMIYMGGNDAGRFIPALLGATRGGEPPIVLTQNSLADSSYLEYVRFQYGDKLNPLTSEDSQNTFQAYLADAQKRLQHDRDFPDEARQLRPGEDVQLIEGRLQVSGQIAVSTINEQLLHRLLQKNPVLAFALAESFPFQSLYADATPLGPITELRVTDAASALTADRAAESLDYWRSTTQTLLADHAGSSTVRKAYAKLILGQAGLFEDRKLTAAAESAYQLATSLNPGNPEAVLRYVNLLMQQQRHDEARQVMQTAASAAPDNQHFRELLSNLNRMR